MIRVNVMYPKKDGVKFDYDYYLNSHVPMVQEKVGGAMKRAEIYKGISGAGGGPEPYVTIASLWFDSVQAFEQAFGPHVSEIMGDIPNFTNVDPTVQIEEQLLG